MKQVLDPEAPTSSFKIDPEPKRAIPPKGTPPVLNPFDENAIEEALRLREKYEGKVTVISMGPPQVEAALRSALAMGAPQSV